MIYLQQSCSLNKNYIQRTLCEFKWYSYGMLTSQNMTPWFVSLAQGSYETVEQVIYYLIKVSYRPQHYRQRKKETEKWICITLGRQDTLFICVLHEAWSASPRLQFSLSASLIFSCLIFSSPSLITLLSIIRRKGQDPWEISHGKLLQNCRCKSGSIFTHMPDNKQLRLTKCVNLRNPRRAQTV